jgi:hypothetical protein
MSEEEGDGDGTNALEDTVGDMMAGRFNGDTDTDTDHAESASEDTTASDAPTAEEVIETAGPVTVEDGERTFPKPFPDEAAAQLGDTSGPTREWPQVNMALPEDLHAGLEARYQVENAHRTINGREQISKAAFNVAVTRYVLATMTDDDLRTHLPD